MNWLQQALTDAHGEFDVAQIGVGVAIFGMLGLAGYSLVASASHTLDFGQLGTGLAAVIGALGVYKWGDSKTQRGGNGTS
jgi:hypothetical protein